MSDKTEKIPLSELKQKRPLSGKVTRIELSGAFVDVGAEKEGWLHISALGNGKVNRIQDILHIGQEIGTWVRKVDLSKGELQLTMVQPLAYDWDELQPGTTVHGKITRIEKFGIFLDFGAERPGLIHISELSHDYVKDTAMVANIGDEKDAIILDVDRKKRQVHLSCKALEPKPAPKQESKPASRREPKPAPKKETKPIPKEEVVIVEEEAIPTVTTMEAAFLAAQAAGTNNSVKKTAQTRNRSGRNRQQQEDILKRTLQTAQRK
jgi:small subunit ribosomal protein S1